MIKLFILIGLSRLVINDVSPLSLSVAYAIVMFLLSGFNILYAGISFVACLIYLNIVKGLEDSFFTGLLITAVGAIGIWLFV